MFGKDCKTSYDIRRSSETLGRGGEGAGQVVGNILSSGIHDFFEQNVKFSQGKGASKSLKAISINLLLLAQLHRND